MRGVGNNPSRDEKHYGCSDFREEKFSAVFLKGSSMTRLCQTE